MIFTKHSTKDAWMRTPMNEKLFYICRQTDSVKDLPSNPDREANVSGMFFKDKIKALIALKDLCESRANHYTCRLMEIEMDIAKEKHRLSVEGDV